MSVEVISKLSDRAVTEELASSFAREDENAAALLLRIAEFDARKLYVPAGYPSMFAYCVGKLRRSPDAVNKRIRAARIARQFPAIFASVAAGRLYLTSVLQLGAYLTDTNVNELLVAAAYKSGPDIAQLLAERFPKPDVPTRLEPVSIAGEQLAAQPVGGGVPESLDLEGQLAAQPVDRRSVLTPRSADRVAVWFTIDTTTQEKLRYVQRLLGHENPAHDLPNTFDRALDALARELEKKKFAATDKPHPRRAPSTTPRHIPAEVKRAVWERDGGQCSFVADDGHRCPARTHLEFDHIDPVARGGRSSTTNVRLRCRAHNQYAAERAFGAEFMRHKRKQARDDAAKLHSSRSPASWSDACGTQRPGDDVVPWLLKLGFKAREAREAVACCDVRPDAPLQERVRDALSHVPRPARTTTVGRGPGS